ncbi:unnamed protein product, partial [Mesorhabditis belari]|uniref:VWFA domain-containing protein n=1 Tax=Mesorhabditis belari TaxID=2138241 RepID=A0AAF3EXD1_9BILA
MILRFGLFLLALVYLATAAQDCLCYGNQTAASIFTPTNPRDNEYNSCYPPGGACPYIAATGNSSLVLANIQFNTFSSASQPNDLQIIIMDGPTMAFDLRPADLNNPDIVKALANFVSQTSELDISMKFYNGVKDGIISFYFRPQLKVTIPTLPPTTPPPTFATVSGAPSQPALIGADIAFAYVSAGSDLSLFQKMSDAITATVTSLNVVTTNTSPAGVRLSFCAPSKTNSANTFGDQWDLDLDTFNSFVQVVPKKIGLDKSLWVPALEAFVGSGGYFDSSSDHRPRENVQKIFVFFTQSSPSEDADTLKPLLSKLAELDVHMVVVDVRPGPDTYFNGLLDNDSGVKNFAYMNLAANNGFLFDYVLQSDKDPKYGCTYDQAKTSFNITETPLTLSWPQAFGGDTQYCNNQETILNLESKVPNTMNLCVSVPSYYLETERDYLRFYAGGMEIASFTGLDVVGSKFLIPGNQTTVTFYTNENTIYEGVQFEITATTEAACP